MTIIENLHGRQQDINYMTKSLLESKVTEKLPARQLESGQTYESPIEIGWNV